MLKQSPSRNQRSQGFKVKHVFQVCLLLVISVWLLNRLRHSYGSNIAYEDGPEKMAEKLTIKQEPLELGRKGLHPREEEIDSDIGSQVDKADLEEEMEEIKPEEIEDEGRGGGDDEIDGHDQERGEEEESEEVEDLIDVDDRERGDNNEEDQEGEEKDNRIETASSQENQDQSEAQKDFQEAREGHYQSNVKSSLVMTNRRTISAQFLIGGLGKVKERRIDNAEALNAGAVYSHNLEALQMKEQENRRKLRTSGKYKEVYAMGDE